MGKTPQPRFTFKGHARAFFWAVVCGMAAYGVIRLMLLLSRSLGSPV